MSYKIFYDMKKIMLGDIVINVKDAEVIRKFYNMFLERYPVRYIVDFLKKEYKNIC